MPTTKAEAAAVALKAIRDAAPGVFTLTETAAKVAESSEVTVATARNWLRAACAAGDLLELTPWSSRFIVKLPGAEAAGLGPFYIAVERTGPYRADPDRHVITTDADTRRPSSYGPGRTTYVADPGQIREYVQQLADEKKAKEQAERADARDAKEAQRREIGRRFPGSKRLMRRLKLLGKDTRDDRSQRVTLLEGELRLSNLEENVDVTERRLHLDIRVWGDANVAIMQSILEAGISAHVADQPLTLCKHCSQRVLRTAGDRQWWWHVDTTNASCAEGDTKAEPAEES